jgi:hypothetical protein
MGKNGRNTHHVNNARLCSLHNRNNRTTCLDLIKLSYEDFHFARIWNVVIDGVIMFGKKLPEKFRSRIQTLVPSEVIQMIINVVDTCRERVPLNLSFSFSGSFLYESSVSQLFLPSF